MLVGAGSVGRAYWEDEHTVARLEARQETPCCWHCPHSRPLRCRSQTPPMLDGGALVLDFPCVSAASSKGQTGDPQKGKIQEQSQLHNLPVCL